MCSAVHHGQGGAQGQAWPRSKVLPVIPMLLLNAIAPSVLTSFTTRWMQHGMAVVLMPTGRIVIAIGATCTYQVYRGIRDNFTRAAQCEGEWDGLRI
mmetsp:Transcript_32064/g.72358  ORF Transcript_32064/g.72358 Transcript_32064/m.72358 type:complete len:97 (-) Transcript_32064:681-971(-)